MHEAARAVAAVGKIDAHGIAWSGELRDAHAALHEAQNFFDAEEIGGPGAQIVARADFHRAAPRLAQRLDLLAEEAVDLGVGIAGEQAFARGQLHGIGQGVVEFFKDGIRLHLASRKLAIEFGRQAKQKLLVHDRMQAPEAREVGGLFEPALADAPRYESFSGALTRLISRALAGPISGSSSGPNIGLPSRNE